MNVNINYLFTRVIVLILTTELPTVLTAALPTKPSTATKGNALRKGIRRALYCNVTANGNSKGAPCIFPFFYNGAFYNDCVSFDRPNPWCSTTDNYTRDGKWGECLDYDVCQRYNNLSDPWRNIGFNLSSYPNLQMKDLNLQEGWYRFKGFSGDRMGYYCIRDTVSVQNLDCGAGLILYYLVPIKGVYRTCHSSCSKSSCGLNNYCNSSDGSCRCDCGFGIQTEKGSSTCTAVPEGHCVISVMMYDMLDMRNTILLRAEVNKKDEAKPNSALNNTQLNNPVNIIVTHATAVAVNSSKLCLTWEKMVNGSCRIIPIDSNRTMCSCDDPEIFDDNNQGFTGERLDMLIIVATPVGLLFLSLTLLTFVLCGRQLNVTNTAQVNLCISLLLAHLLFLFKGGFLKYIRANQVACAVLAGLLHFLFLSSFVWMFIDAVLLFISAKNLTKIRSKQKKMLGWKYLTVIGYVIPLLVVGVSVAVVPNGYSSKICWLENNQGFYWSFLGPVYFILAANVILFIAIFITVTFSLKSLNNEILQRTQTQDDKKLIRSVLFKTMTQFFILGCPWILGLSISSSIILEIIFVILISQQGTVIFLVHCVLNQEVRKQYRKWLCTCSPFKKATTINNGQMTKASCPSTDSSQHYDNNIR